jgi:PncC family amidohydrolase
MYNFSMITDQRLEVQIGLLLRNLKLKLAVAESCTGGLVCHYITNIPGSSDYFLGGIISYSNDVKKELLSVNSETLMVHGAVSEETVIEMARGVRLILNADIAISTSGIAGPGGGTKVKPVGLTCIGSCDSKHEFAWRHVWHGDRLSIKEQTAQAALQHLLDLLKTMK